MSSTLSGPTGRPDVAWNISTSDSNIALLTDADWDVEPHDGRLPAKFWDGEAEEDEDGQAGFRGDGATTPAESIEFAAAFLKEKYDAGKYFAIDVCIICDCLKAAESGGSIAKLAVEPVKHTSRYSPHLKHVTWFSEEEAARQYITVPGSCKLTSDRTPLRIPVCPPHERLNE